MINKKTIYSVINNYTNSISSRRRVIDIFSSEDKKYLYIDEEN